jgi:cytochrome c oxidase cbb3-type subunit 4
MTPYETWRELVASSGLLLFALIFIAAVAYAYWPSHRERFERAAQTPLRED